MVKLILPSPSLPVITRCFLPPSPLLPPLRWSQPPPPLVTVPPRARVARGGRLETSHIVYIILRDVRKLARAKQKRDALGRGCKEGVLRKLGSWEETPRCRIYDLYDDGRLGLRARGLASKRGSSFWRQLPVWVWCMTQRAGQVRQVGEAASGLQAWRGPADPKAIQAHPGPSLLFSLVCTPHPPQRASGFESDMNLRFQPPTRQELVTTAQG